MGFGRKFLWPLALGNCLKQDLPDCVIQAGTRNTQNVQNGVSPGGRYRAKNVSSLPGCCLNYGFGHNMLRPYCKMILGHFAVFFVMKAVTK